MHLQHPMWRVVLRFVPATLLLFSALAAPSAVRADGRNGIIFEGTFERGDLTGFYWHQNKPELVTADREPVRAGNYAMRCYLHRQKSDYSYRTEVIVGSDQNAPPDTQSEFKFRMGQEYWVGFSSFLPNEFVPDVDRMSEVVFQMQASPDSGEDYRSPVFALEVNADTWRIFSRWDTRANSGGGNDFSGGEIVFSEKLGAAIGSWTDWVIHVKWSWQSDGFLQVWRNGQLVVDRTGPNCSNDREGPHVAIGLYKWPWKDSSNPATTNVRLIYHDELRIGNSSASYADVAPGGEPATAPAPAPRNLPAPEPVPGEVIVDNADAQFALASGADRWKPFQDKTPQSYGGSHVYSPEPGGGKAVATWTFTVPFPGRYNVYAWWPASNSRPTDVPYTVHSDSGATTVRVNQQRGGGMWNRLGQFDFSSGGSVTVSDDVSSGRVVADAIRLTPAGDPAIYIPTLHR